MESFDLEEKIMFWRIGFSVTFVLILAIGATHVLSTGNTITPDKILHAVYPVGVLVFFGINWIVFEIKEKI